MPTPMQSDALARYIDGHLEHQAACELGPGRECNCEHRNVMPALKSALETAAAVGRLAEYRDIHMHRHPLLGHWSFTLKNHTREEGHSKVDVVTSKASLPAAIDAAIGRATQ